RSDASARYERGLDPNLSWEAAMRAVQLIQDICPGSIVRHYEDEYPTKREPIAISFPFDRIEKLLGMQIEEKTVESVLSRLGFAPKLASGQIFVTAPTNRSDVTIPEDIIEEVARVVGYDNLP